MTKEFSDWWNDDLLSANNPYHEDTPAYWAWEGWQAGVAAEREACAKVCEGNYDTAQAARAIRARGEV
jgi:hypothetical protein